MGDQQPNTTSSKSTLQKKRSLAFEPQPLAKSRRQNYSNIQADKQMEKESARVEFNDFPTSPEPLIQSSPSSSPEWDNSYYSPSSINPQYSSKKLVSTASKQKKHVDSYPPSPETSPTHSTPSVSNSNNNKRSNLKRSSEEVQEAPSLDFFIDTLHGSLDPYQESESSDNNVNNTSSYWHSRQNNNSNEKNNNNSNNMNSQHTEDEKEDEEAEEDKEEEEEDIITHRQSKPPAQHSEPMRFNSFRLTPPKKVVAPSKEIVDLRTPSPKPKREHSNSNNRFAPISDQPAQYSIAIEDETLDDLEWPEELPSTRPVKTSQEVPQQKQKLKQSKLIKPPRSEPQPESNRRNNINVNNVQPYPSSRWRDDLPQAPSSNNRYSSFRDLLPYAELNRSTARQNAPQPSSQPPSVGPYPPYSSLPSFVPAPASAPDSSEPVFNTDEELARHLQLMEQYGPNAERMIAQAPRRHGTSLGMTGARQAAPRPVQPSQDEEIARRMQEMEYNRAFVGAPSFPSARGFDPMGIMQTVFARRRGAPMHSHAHAHSHSGPGGVPLQMRLAMTNRDFTDQDYEMLLQLDEQVVKKGASKNDIQHLPTRKIKEGETVENCVICLSEMEPGSEVKLLPCAHYFHSECIEQWLKMNKCCPIDKKDITEDH